MGKFGEPREKREVGNKKMGKKSSRRGGEMCESVGGWIVNVVSGTRVVCRGSNDYCFFLFVVIFSCC